MARSAGPTAAEIWKDKERRLDAEIESGARVEILKHVLAKAPKSITRRELGFMGARLLAELQNTDMIETLASVIGLGADAPAKAGSSGRVQKERAIEKRILARLRNPESERMLYLDVLALALAPAVEKFRFEDEVTGGNLLDQAAESYGVDVKAVIKQFGAARRAEFAREKAAALAKAKTKKPAKAKAQAAKAR